MLAVVERLVGRGRAARRSRSSITHLGLLFWEMRYISASLAFPGLKPISARLARRTPSRLDDKESSTS